MASAAAAVTLTAADTLIFDATDDGGKCAEFLIGVRAGSAFPALVRISELHKSGEYVGIPIGIALTFRLGNNGIARVNAKGDGGSTLVDFGVVSKTMP